MGLDIERQVFNGIKTVLLANAYITTNAIPVKDAGDNSLERTPPCIYIDAVSAVPENSPRDKYWIVSLTIASETYIPNDNNKNILYAIHQEVMQEICKTTLLNYSNAMPTLNVDDIIITVPTRQDIDNKYQRIFMEVNIHASEI